METKLDGRTTSAKNEDATENDPETNIETDLAEATKIGEDTVDEDLASYSSSELQTIDDQDLHLENYNQNGDLDDIPTTAELQNVVLLPPIDVAKIKLKGVFRDNKLVPCNSCEFLEPVIAVRTTCCFRSCVRYKSIKTFNNFWLISVPKTDDTLKELDFETKKDDLSYNFKFHMPILKTGNLNVLVSLIEQLSTLDKFVRDTTEQIVAYMKSEVQVKSSILEENFKVNGLDPATYLTRFTWNTAKYAVGYSVPLMADVIFTHVDRIQKSFREKTTLFDNLKSNLKKYEKRETENLQNRYLGDIVKKEHFITDSQFLETLLVVVPNNRIKKWVKAYESLCDMIVPSSSKRIFWDGTDSLFTVTLYRKNIESFKDKAREKQFIVRDFRYSEKIVLTENAYYENLSRFKMRQLAAIFRWARVNFSECFEAWIHVKALRVHVESVLRFGLPVNYEAMLLIPLRSKTKLKELLNDMYSHVDNSLAAGMINEIPIGLAMYEVEEVFPYVFFEVNLNFINVNK